MWAMENATAQLIHSLGGASAVARRLGFSATSGVQRVCNWIYRDRIPLQMRVDHPDLFPMHPQVSKPLAGRSSAALPPD